MSAPYRAENFREKFPGEFSAITGIQENLNQGLSNKKGVINLINYDSYTKDDKNGERL